MIKGRNFSDQITPSVVDVEYQDCNFMQNNCIDVAGEKRAVRIFPGDDTSRIFIDCNMTNCEPPPGSVVKKADGTLTGGTIIERMIIAATDTVEIDGEVIVVNEYADRIYGSLYEGVYSYHVVPIDQPRRAI